VSPFWIQVCVLLLAVALGWALLRAGALAWLKRLLGGQASDAQAFAQTRPHYEDDGAPQATPKADGELVVKQLCLAYMQGDTVAINTAQARLLRMHDRGDELARHLQLVFESLALIERTKSQDTLTSRLQVATLNVKEACALAPEMLTVQHRNELIGVLQEAASGRLEELNNKPAKRRARPLAVDDNYTGPYVMRGGRSRPADAAFLAWTSGELWQMLQAVAKPAHPVDRHFLLQCIVSSTYKQRTDPEMRRACREHAELYLAECPKLLPALKREWKGDVYHVSVFEHYATVLTEDGEIDQAVEVCRTAIGYGLHDNTKSGYEGRILRILKKKR
jgi:hypothetical protein